MVFSKDTTISQWILSNITQNIFDNLLYSYMCFTKTLSNNKNMFMIPIAFVENTVFIWICVSFLFYVGLCSIFPYGSIQWKYLQNYLSRVNVHPHIIMLIIIFISILSYHCLASSIGSLMLSLPPKNIFIICIVSMLLFGVSSAKFRLLLHPQDKDYRLV